jgi:hypothetical protein
MILAKSLGMVPAWQYNQGWAQNPKYNRHVAFPPGMDQMTPQPVGPYYAPPPEAGLGAARVRDCFCDSGHEWCCTNRRFGFRGLGISDVWATRLTVGGAVLAGVAAIAGLWLSRK